MLWWGLCPFPACPSCSARHSPPLRALIIDTDAPLSALPSPAVPPHHTPPLGRFVPFSGARDGLRREERIDRSALCVSSPSLSRRLLSPLLSTLHRAARILSGQGFPSSARGVLNAARGKEDRTRCWSLAFGGERLGKAAAAAEIGLARCAVQCCRGDGNLPQVSGLLLLRLSSHWLFWFFSTSLSRFGFHLRSLPWEEDAKRIYFTSVRSPEARSWNFFFLSCQIL